MGFKTVLFFLETVGITALYASSYFLPDTLNFSVYGAYLLIYFVLQTVTSGWNDENMRRIEAPPPVLIEDEKKEFSVVSLEEPRVVLLVIGHRENPEYWKKCLSSVFRLKTSNLRKVYILIDGDTPEDLFMYSIAHLKIREEQPEGFPPVSIIMAEKRGKRGMLYMGFEKARDEFFKEQQDMLVAVTDSDTELKDDCLLQLEKCIEADPRNGCCTGLLTIYNLEDGILPKLINARYRYAFAIERACLSYFGCMTCCSGPLSMFRLKALTETVMKRFITQTIGGVPCEPGDDRHLTNLVMQQGYLSRQTSYAMAATEAPETLVRFLLQQLRWSRSFYREIRWQIGSLEKQSLFLGFSTVYESVFPWFILVWVIYLLYGLHPVSVYIKAILLSIGILSIRTLIMLCRFRDLNIAYNILYYPVYFIFLLPTKIFGGLTFLNNTWVTQTRDTNTWRCSNDALFYFGFLALWQVMLVTGFAWTTYRLID